MAQPTLERYLGRLKELQTDYPTQAVRTPQGRDAFELGKICGVAEGLARAEQLLAEVLGEEKDDGE